MRIVGLDIGGANLKIASLDGICLTIPFPMWKQSGQLTSTLRLLPADAFGNPDMIALTMTAELADCFATKSEGVRFIIDSVKMAFPETPIRVWLTSGEFAEPDDAQELPMLAAAANWHVLATWAGRAVPRGPALLVDVGSTTTDIIPIYDGLPVSEGQTDLERLSHQELVYTGTARTPVCAMVRTVTLHGTAVPVAAELFATSLDVHLLTGDIPEDDQNVNTADGRPATRVHAANRLAHMLCCDTEELSMEELQHVAAEIAEVQVSQIASAIADRLRFALEWASELAECVRAECEQNSGDSVLDNRNVPDSQTVSAKLKPVIILSGSGQFLAVRALSQAGVSTPYEVMNLSQMYRHPVSDAACAFAAARLCADRCLDDLLPIQPW